MYPPCLARSAQRVGVGVVIVFGILIHLQVGGIRHFVVIIDIRQVDIAAFNVQPFTVAFHE